MALITLRQLLDHAADNGYGVPAFNINNMEQGLAIMDAAAVNDVGRFRCQIGQLVVKLGFGVCAARADRFEDRGAVPVGRTHHLRPPCPQTLHRPPDAAPALAKDFAGDECDGITPGHLRSPSMRFELQA